MNGYLLINKDKGPTSHDVVFKIRKIAKTKKVGHTGTLDPIATGLMVVCIGNATKASDYITNGDKAYIATMEFGFISDTLDNTGEITALPQKELTNSEITDAINSFKGEISQTPPMYSAKKINGQKLYEIARQGKTIQRESVAIQIKDIKILEIANHKVKFFVQCSKGTYIRSLIDDIGKLLNYGAIMTDLIRIQSGIFNMQKQKAYTISELSKLDDTNEIEKLLYPVDTAFLNYNKLIIPNDIEKLIKNGIAIDLARAGIANEYENNELLRIYNENNIFIAIMQIYDGNKLKLKTTFFTN
jgi:tRNA pseudouridine55 synthase